MKHIGRLDVTQEIYGGQKTTAEIAALVPYQEGAIIWDTDLKDFYKWNGSSWVAMGSGGGVVGAVTVTFVPATNLLTVTVDGVSDTATISAIGVFQSGTGAPTVATPVTPILYVDDATADIYRYNGATWDNTKAVTSNVLSDSVIGVYPIGTPTTTFLTDILASNKYDNHIVRTDAVANVAPTAVEVPSPVITTTAKVQLTDGNVEFWSHDGTSWGLDFTLSGGANAFDNHIVRTNTTAGVAPTVGEIAVPIANMTAKVQLSNNFIEYWSHDGATWTLDFTNQRWTSEQITAVGVSTPDGVPDKLWEITNTGALPDFDGSLYNNGERLVVHNISGAAVVISNGAANYNVGGVISATITVADNEILTLSRDIATDNWLVTSSNLSSSSNITTGTLAAATGARVVDMGNNDLSFTNLATDALDSDSSDSLLTIDGGGVIGRVHRNSNKVVDLVTSPVDGTTIAYYQGQLFWDYTNKNLYEALTKSTDPDAAGTGSTFAQITLGDAWTEAATISVATTASGTNLEIIPVSTAGSGLLTLNGSDYTDGDLIRVVNIGTGTNSIAGDQAFTKNNSTTNPYIQAIGAATTFQRRVGGGWTVVAEVLTNTLDGYHKDINRANTTINVPPTVGEYAAPIDGSSCHITLANGNIEHWNYNTAWTLQSTEILGGYQWFDTGVKDIKIEANQDPTAWITETAIGTYDIVEPLGGSVRSISWIQEITATAQQNAPGGVIIFNLDTSANGGNTGDADAGAPNAYGKATNNEVFGFRSVNAPGAPFTASATGGVLTMTAAGMAGIWDDGSKMYIENIKNV